MSTYQRLSVTGLSKPLDRQSLPAPLRYLSERGLLKRKPSGEWVAICCPAHKDGAEENPSLRVSLMDGHFRCMACGVRGGDIVALHRLVTGLGFRDAVRDLGGHFHD
jgi:DNA primase